MRTTALMLVAACGGSPEPGRTPTTAPAAMTATAAGPDDVVVATVAGRPVWGSCVSAQAARMHVAGRAALDECVAFELLAQAAEARGLATDPEVIEETRRAAVSRLVELGFERSHRLEDMQAEIDRRIAADPMRVHERRNSAFLRVNVPTTAPPEAWIRAKIVADRLHAELADQTGMFQTQLDDAVARVPHDGFQVEVTPYRVVRRGQSVPSFEEALFAIPEVGRVSPVTRTKWGWDIILLTELHPARSLTRDDVLPLAYDELRAKAFERWVGELVREASIEVHPERLEPPPEASAR